MLGVYLICATYRHILDVVVRLSVIGFQEKKISPRGAGLCMSGISDRPSIARCGLALAISRVVGAISTIAAIIGGVLGSIAEGLPSGGGSSAGLETAPTVLQEHPRNRPDLAPRAWVDVACQLCRCAGASHLVSRTGSGHACLRLVRCRPYGAQRLLCGTAWGNTELLGPKAEEGSNPLEAVVISMLCCGPGEIVMANEVLDGTNMIGEFLGKR
jgi:hypothetical protein